MKNLIIGLIVAVCSSATLAQSVDREILKENREGLRRDQSAMKKQAASSLVQPLAAATPNPFNDTDSFGQSVLFLGSMYAGTVYVYHSCDPTILSAELGLTLAADDHCIEKPTGGNTGPTQDIFDTVWQVTIPKDTIQNVVYPLVQNSVFVENDGLATGSASYSYSPRVTIESDALNDPAAIDPNTGLPMNGSFTASLSGAAQKGWTPQPGEFENQNYASVGARGFSRAYFRGLGLPDNVINKLFKKKMTLKFGIRVRVSGALDFGQFFYQFRLMGQ